MLESGKPSIVLAKNVEKYRTVKKYEGHYHRVSNRSFSQYKKNHLGHSFLYFLDSKFRLLHVQIKQNLNGSLRNRKEHYFMFKSKGIKFA